MPNLKPGRPTSGLRRWPLAHHWTLFLFAALGLGGASLLMLSWGRAHRMPGDPGPPPQPSWYAQAAPRQHFQASVQPIPGDQASQVPLPLNLVRAALKNWPLQTTGQTTYRITRVLRTGHQFDSTLQINWQTDGPRTDLRLEAHRAIGPPLHYELTLDGMTLTGGQFSAGEFHRAFGATTLQSDLPIGIGDLQISDALALYAAAQAGNFRVIGTLEGMGSSKLLILEVPMQDTPSPPSLAANESAGDDPPTSLRGTVALIHLHAATYAPSAVRIFDAADRLVRVYDEIELSLADQGPRLTRLRAYSIPNQSHTIFQLQ